MRKRSIHGVTALIIVAVTLSIGAAVWVTGGDADTRADQVDFPQPIARAQTRENRSGAEVAAIALLRRFWSNRDIERLLPILSVRIDTAYQTDTLPLQMASVQGLARSRRAFDFVLRYPYTLSLIADQQNPNAVADLLGYVAGNRERVIAQLTGILSTITDPRDQESALRVLADNRDAFRSLEDTEITYFLLQALMMPGDREQHPGYTAWIEELVHSYNDEFSRDEELAQEYMFFFLNVLDRYGQDLNRLMYNDPGFADGFSGVFEDIKRIIQDGIAHEEAYWSSLPLCGDMADQPSECRESDTPPPAVELFLESASKVLDDPRIFLALADPDFEELTRGGDIPTGLLLQVFWGPGRGAVAGYDWTYSTPRVFQGAGGENARRFLAYGGTSPEFISFAYLHNRPGFEAIYSQRQYGFDGLRCLAMATFQAGLQGGDPGNSGFESAVDRYLEPYWGDSNAVLEERCGLTGDRWYEFLPGAGFVEIGRKYYIGIPADMGDYIAAAFDTLTVVTLGAGAPLRVGASTVARSGAARVVGRWGARIGPQRLLRSYDRALVEALRRGGTRLAGEAAEQVIDIQARATLRSGFTGIGGRSLEFLAGIGRRLGLDTNGFVVLLPESSAAGHAVNAVTYQAVENLAMQEAIHAIPEGITDVARRGLAEIIVLWQHRGDVENLAAVGH